MPFKKGDKNINRGGRPKHSLNKANPQKKLVQAMSNGYDIKDLKRLIIEMIKDKEVKLSEKAVVDLLKLAMTNEVELIKIAFKQEVEDGKEKASAKKDSDKKDEEDDDGAIFSLKAL